MTHPAGWWSRTVRAVTDVWIFDPNLWIPPINELAKVRGVNARHLGVTHSPTKIHPLETSVYLSSDTDDG